MSTMERFYEKSSEIGIHRCSQAFTEAAMAARGALLQAKAVRQPSNPAVTAVPFTVRRVRPRPVLVLPGDQLSALAGAALDLPEFLKGARR